MAVTTICAAIWRTGQERGWLALTISISAIAYAINHYRCQPQLLPSTLVAIPLVALLLFCLALGLGLHHQPGFMVAAGFQWAPFTTFQDRVMHAFALSIWAFIFGTPTVILCGSIRRFTMVVSLTCQTDATNIPIAPSVSNADLNSLKPHTQITTSVGTRSRGFSNPNPPFAFYIAGAFVVMGTLMLCSIMDTKVRGLFLVPYVFGPILLALVPMWFCRAKASQDLFLFATYTYAVWFFYMYFTVISPKGSPFSIIGMLYVGIVAAPFLFVLCVIAMAFHAESLRS